MRKRGQQLVVSTKKFSVCKVIPVSAEKVKCEDKKSQAA